MQSRPYLIAAVGAYTTFVAFQLITFMLRNLVLRSRCVRSHLVTKGDGVHLNLEFRAPLKLQPGQFVYLWMPGVSFLSLFRTHPFMVAWQRPEKFLAERERNKGKGSSVQRRFSQQTAEEQELGRTITLMLHPTGGFGMKLKQMAQHDYNFLTWIDGPYGTPPQWGAFDHIVFVASGIGLAAHMLPIKHLIEGRQERSVITKTVSLYWQVENSRK